MSQAPARESKLDPLTSLRFFAALMIVVHHAESMLGVGGIGVNWGQGVSFFFVLSGFILTHVYPRLGTLHDTGRFLRARVARIWPAHVACFALGFVLVPYTWDTPTAIANLLLVHAWIPKSAYYFSYNGVSWSVSTEAFFYLAFPLLLISWQRTWWLKFGAACLGLALVFIIVDRSGLPAYGSPLGTEGHLATQHGLLYIHPATRIFEFILGMVAATVWQKARRPLPTALSTALEVAALLACAATMAYGNPLARYAQEVLASDALMLWLSHSGSLFAFAALIMVMANGGGLVSRALATPALVLAGEISFSMYLLHQMLMVVLSRNLSFLSNLPGPLIGLGYFIVLLCLSYLMWVWVEVPGRRLLLGGGTIHGSSAMAKSWNRHLPRGRGVLVAGALLVAVAGAFQYAVRTHPGLVRSDQAAADAMTPEGLRTNVDARFGDFVRIAGAKIECDDSTLRLAFVWQKLGDRPGGYTTAVHFVDAAGTILGQADFPQPKGVPRLAIGGYWTDEASMPLDKLGPAAVAAAVGVYDAAGVLLVTRHPLTDWDGRRLILPLHDCRPRAPWRRPAMLFGTLGPSPPG